MSARVGAYYAKDGWVRKRSERAANPDGSTTYTLDFRVCRMADEVGDEAADTVAALMNLGETAQSELATLRAEARECARLIDAYVSDLRAISEVATRAGEKNATLRAEVERLREALLRIANWCEAYPASVFPKANADAALEACKAAGIPVDAMHGTWARHLLDGIGRDARAALEPTP